MELHSKESLRAIPADSEFLFPTDDSNRGFNTIAYFANNQCFAFVVCHPGDCD